MDRELDRGCHLTRRTPVPDLVTRDVGTRSCLGLILSAFVSLPPSLLVWTRPPGRRFGFSVHGHRGVPDNLSPRGGLVWGPGMELLFGPTPPLPVPSPPPRQDGRTCTSGLPVHTPLQREIPFTQDSRSRRNTVPCPLTGDCVSVYWVYPCRDPGLPTVVQTRGFVVPSYERHPTPRPRPHPSPSRGPSSTRVPRGVGRQRSRRRHRRTRRDF